MDARWHACAVPDIDRMYWTAADGSGHPQAIAGSLSGDLPCSVSPDGDTLAFMRQNAQTSRDIYVLSLGGQSGRDRW